MAGNNAAPGQSEMKFNSRVLTLEGSWVMVYLPVFLLIAASAGCGKSGNASSEPVPTLESTRLANPASVQEPPVTQTATSPDETAEDISTEDFFKQGVIPRFRILASENCLHQLES